MKKVSSLYCLKKTNSLQNKASSARLAKSCYFIEAVLVLAIEQRLFQKIFAIVQRGRRLKRIGGADGKFRLERYMKTHAGYLETSKMTSYFSDVYKKYKIPERQNNRFGIFMCICNKWEQPNNFI
ncbi:hypothetical protein [Sporolactobacillus putidus]|uniref:hypothetical protein n=1 Tax=Sporolactobacillus putidus TaxID=492735 RepID=UPI001665B732|nr:hypothetical protein [Sporolactobacillus putidus]